jgi:hypothetical protein
MNSAAIPSSQMSAARAALVQAVKDYALEHYSDRKGIVESDGWDTVIEAMSDQQIAIVTGKTSTEKAAIEKVRRYLNLKSDVLSTLPENFYEL